MLLHRDAGTVDLWEFGKYKKNKEPLPLVAVTVTKNGNLAATKITSGRMNRRTSRDVYVRVATDTQTTKIDEKSNLYRSEDDNNMLSCRQLRAALKYAATMRFDDVTSSSTEPSAASQFLTPVVTSTKYLQYRKKYRNFQQPRAIIGGRSSTTSKKPHLYYYY